MREPPHYPAGLLPVADNTDGNLWIFDYRAEPPSPSVVFIDHELDDEEGVTPVAPDFASFPIRIALPPVGQAVFRKRLPRAQLLSFFAVQPAYIVATEACVGAHHWGRELDRPGHTARLIPPAYVEPFVTRQKNDAADAEAICEADGRPSIQPSTPRSGSRRGRALPRPILRGLRPPPGRPGRGAAGAIAAWHVLERGLRIPPGQGHAKGERVPVPGAHVALVPRHRGLIRRCSVAARRGFQHPNLRGRSRDCRKCRFAPGKPCDPAVRFSAR